MVKKARFPIATILVLTLIYAFNFIDRQIVAVIGTELQNALSLNNTQLGFLYGTVFSFFYAFAGIPMGHLADRFSRKWMIIGGLLIWSTATVLSGFAGSFMSLIIFRIIVAVAESACSPAAYSLISDMVPPEKHATAISVYASGIFIGVGSSFLFGGTISNTMGWREALIGVGFPGILVGIVAIFIIKNVPHKHAQESAGNFSDFFLALKNMFSKPVIALHLIGFAFLSLSGYSLLAFLSQILSVQHSSPHLIPHYGWFMFGTGITITLSGLMADKLAQIHPRYRFVMGIIAALGGLPLYLLGIFADTGLSALILIGSGALIASSYNGVAAALIQILVPKTNRALAGGVYLFVISVAGFGTGPLLTGYLMDTVFSGPQAASQALSVVLTVSGILASGFLFAAMKRYDETLSISIEK